MEYKPFSIIHIGLLEDRSNPLKSIKFNHNGTSLITGNSIGEIQLWDVMSGQEFRTIKSYTEEVRDLLINSDSSRIVSFQGTPFQGTPRLWDIENGKVLALLTGQTVAFNLDGTRLITYNNWSDKEICLLNAQTGEQIEALNGSRAIFTSDGLSIVSIDRTIVRIWNAQTGAELFTLKGHDLPIKSIAIAPSNKYVASADENTLRIWKTDTGEQTNAVNVHCSLDFDCIAFSPDDRYIAIIDPYEEYDYEALWCPAKLVEIVTGKVIKLIAGSVGWAGDFVQFAPDGSCIIVISSNLEVPENTIINIWDMLTFEEVASPSGLYIIFNAQGSISAIGDWNHIILWHLQTGFAITLPGNRLTVDADWNRIATLDSNGTVHIYQINYLK